MVWSCLSSNCQPFSSQANYVALDTFLSELATNLLKPSPSSNNLNEDSRSNSAFNEMNDDDENLFKSLYFKPEITQDAISSAQSRLYKHTMTCDFSKKWNLPIYYQLRFGEACARLDKAIDRVQSEGWHTNVFMGTEATARLLRESAGFEIPFFLEAYDIMMWLWRDDVFLKPLTHRFLRGAMQLLGRIVSFVEEGLKGEIKFGIKSKLEVETDSKIDPKAATRPLIDYSYHWNERIDEVAAVSWDLTKLETCVGHDYVGKIANAISPSDYKNGAVQYQESESNEIKELIESALVEAAEGISPIIEKSWNDIIVDALTNQCSEPLVAVKGVAATYRMTNRPPPTQASPFVATILSPLKEFTGKFSNRIPPKVGFEWKKKVVESVAEKYCIAVSELTETVQRTEEALKNRKARRTAAGGMSDGEKVKLQLLLDQREFSNHVQDVGVDTESVEYVKRLVTLTISAETLIS